MAVMPGEAVNGVVSRGGLTASGRFRAGGVLRVRAVDCSALFRGEIIVGEHKRISYFLDLCKQGRGEATTRRSALTRSSDFWVKNSELVGRGGTKRAVFGAKKGRQAIEIVGIRNISRFW